MMTQRPHDDTTKPSRINRRRKKRWKISLTALLGAAILCASIHRLTGICNPNSNGVVTPIQGVFYCLKKMAALVVRPIILVARSGQPQGWPVSTSPFGDPLPGIANLLRAAAQRFATVGGGFIQAMELPQ